ncbi:MAG: SDR family oxidoreductase [Verrucomicrobiota bacterium]
MKILLTGANGYIGQRLIPSLLDQGHEVYCCVRDRARFSRHLNHERLKTIEVDFLKPQAEIQFPHDLEVAFYLIHSMNQGIGNFAEAEQSSAVKFLQYLQPTDCKQIIYLSGIVNEDRLSKHLQSRLNVEHILRAGGIPTTVLRAGIVVGSGSASFEIIRDLVEKLPVMVAPQWLKTRCQPIAIRNVIEFLLGVMLRPETLNRDFDIAGPETLTYRQMLEQFARVRKLKRLIITVPVMTPRLSSYWLYFITSTSFRLAMNLVDSMKVDIIARKSDLAERLGITLIPYQKAVELALERIEQGNVISGWKDSFASSGTNPSLFNALEVPTHGCFIDRRTRDITGRTDLAWARVWKIGGDTGWYYGNWLWSMRGLLDKLCGGVGLNRGRTDASDIHPGDALDFWRVLVADKQNRRLLLYAEMRLPGEAWLEFKVVDAQLVQTATFRPRGVSGRLYWYSVLPLHHFIFNGMIDALAQP